MNLTLGACLRGKQKYRNNIGMHGVIMNEPAEKNRQRDNGWPRYLLPLLIFFIPLLLYLKTASPTISAGDSGEMVSAAFTLGLLHAPSFPLYVLVGRLFTLLPLGEIAFRVSLLSILCGGLISLIVFLALQSLTRSRLSAVFGSLFLAFMPCFWLQLNRTEVYGLFLFILAVVFFLRLKEELPKNHFFLAIFLALGFAVQPVLAAPLFLVVLYLLIKRKIRLFPVLFCFTLVFFIYFFLPLRSLHIPALNFGNPTNLSNFRAVLMAQVFRGMLGPDWSDVWSYAIYRLPLYLNAACQQYAYLGLLVVGWGAFFAFKEAWKLNWIIFIYLAAIPLFLTNGGVWHKSPDFFAYITPIALSLLFWGGRGVDEIIRLLPKKLAFVIALILLLGWGGFNYHKVNQRANFYFYDYAQNILDSVGKGNICLNLEGDNDYFGTKYLQALGKRTDIKLRGRDAFETTPPLRGLEQAYIYGFFSRYPGDKALNGLIYQTNPPALSPVRYYRTRGYLNEIGKDYDSRWLVAQYYLPLLEHALKNNGRVAPELFDKVTDYGREVPPLLFRVGVIYLDRSDWVVASELFAQVLGLYPRYRQAYNNLGLALRNQKKFSEAASVFERAVKFDPRYFTAHYNLAVTYEMAGKDAKAAAAWQNYIDSAKDIAAEAPYVKKAEKRLEDLKK